MRRAEICERDACERVLRRAAELRAADLRAEEREALLRDVVRVELALRRELELLRCPLALEELLRRCCEEVLLDELVRCEEEPREAEERCVPPLRELDEDPDVFRELGRRVGRLSPSPPELYP